MPDKRLCILICTSFCREAAAIIESDNFRDVSVANYPNRCGRPPLTWDDVRTSVGSTSSFDSIHILGGCCVSYLGVPPPDLAHCQITPFEYCMEMIAGNYTVSSQVAKGAYMVTPGWLAEWPRHISEWGFTQETAREFFAECSRQIVLFDTAVRKNSADEIAGFSNFVDRPCTIMPLGLDLMQLRLQLYREQWRSGIAKNAVQQAQRQFSDYAMAFDLLSTLTRSVDESDVILQITNLYQMMFAATEVAFIGFEHEQPASVAWAGFGGQGNREQLFREVAELNSEYGLLPSGDGFLLKVNHGSSTLGVVKIAGIALPGYVETYLNLALATIGVCGLALQNAHTFREIADKNRELAQAHSELQTTYVQMLQQEKMASIGQLAAGVAHEINNPMGFITSNLGSLGNYATKISEYLGLMERVSASYLNTSRDEVASARARLKIDYVLKDTMQLIEESLDGATRVKNIVDDLKNLSRSDQHEPVLADLNQCLLSALNIASNEIKYVADINRNFGEIPKLLCHPQQISQVFINLLTNAGQAIVGHGTITVSSWHENGWVCVAIADSGKGIPEEIQQRIFEPFFTTKDVGKGTGLGLSLSYDILQKHGGQIQVESTVGQGTTFTVRLPIEMPVHQ